MFAPVGKGLQLTRPLERVEIDEWTIDILSLLASAGILERLSEDDRKAFKLTGKAVSWTLTVAICARTRCILAMVMTPSATATAAVKALEMVLSGKGALSTAVKAYGRWHMHGLPEKIATDCGSAFKSRVFQTACADLGVEVLRTIAGTPEMRGRIERVFRTMSVSLLPELAGRTFSNILEKGDSDPDARACLTENDLAFMLGAFDREVRRDAPARSAQLSADLRPEANPEAEQERIAGSGCAIPLVCYCRPSHAPAPARRGNPLAAQRSERDRGPPWQGLGDRAGGDGRDAWRRRPAVDVCGERGAGHRSCPEMLRRKGHAGRPSRHPGPVPGCTGGHGADR